MKFSMIERNYLKTEYSIWIADMNEMKWKKNNVFIIEAKVGLSSPFLNLTSQSKLSCKSMLIENQ